MIACCAQTARIVIQWAQNERTTHLHTDTRANTLATQRTNWIWSAVRSFRYEFRCKSLFIRFHWILLLSIIIFLMFAAPRKGQNCIFLFCTTLWCATFLPRFIFILFRFCSSVLRRSFSLNEKFNDFRLTSLIILYFLVSFRRPNSELWTIDWRARTHTDTFGEFSSRLH